MFRTTRPTPMTALAAPFVAAALATLLAGCAGSTPAAPSETPSGTSSPAGIATEPHNAADVEFAQGMIVHHAGAIEMAQLATAKSSSPEVLSLADRIAAAQAPEIELMTRWLNQWEEEVPDLDGTGDQMPGMDHAGPMPGAMSDEDMAMLEAETGSAFDAAFLTAMIAHHEGAIEMSEELLSAGSAPAALALAKEIISAQRTEIEEMRGLLAS